MHRNRTILVAAAAAVAIPAAARGVEINYAGQTFDNNDLPLWRTATEEKTLDIDGDNIYGTGGYLMIGTGEDGLGGFKQDFPAPDGAYTLDINEPGRDIETLSDLPSGVSVEDGFFGINWVITGDFYPLIDDPSGGPDRRIGFGRYDNFQTPTSQEEDGLNGVITKFTVGATTPGVDDPDATLRLGVALRNDPNVALSDFVRVQSPTGGVNTGPVENFAGDFGNTVMFYDITNYTVGDEFEIWLYGRDDDGKQSISYSGLTWDFIGIDDPLLPGDANMDGTVDLADFGILRSNFGLSVGATFGQGDFNEDGAVDLADFGILRANFGSSADGPMAVLDGWYATVVPEPGTLALAGVAGMALLRRRR